MKKPKHLDNPPIVDSICEIRFDSSLPMDIVPGVITSALKDLNISDIEKLPILQIPESARNIDANLLYAPYYKAKIGIATLQFGARMIAISSPVPYIGWEKFLPIIESILTKVLDTEIMAQIKRVAIRTVNFFEEDILGNLKFTVSSPIPFNKTQYNYTDHYEDNGFIIRTTIANKASRAISKNEMVLGSVLDIDSYIEKDTNADLSIIKSHIETTHDKGKNIFFDLLNEDFLDSLGPSDD